MQRLGILALDWERQGSRHLPFSRPPKAPQEPLILEKTAATDQLGAQSLWEGYGEGEEAIRTPAKVRTKPLMGRFFSEMVRRVQPETVVEFGTAFGVSGMYWLAALERNQRGHLYTFEVNSAWADNAENNHRSIGNRFTLVRGRFEDHVGEVLGDRQIDMAMIDAVHSSDWVLPQFGIVSARTSVGAIVMCDDINFSDDMRVCWQSLSRHHQVAEAARVAGRVGLLRLR